MKKLTFLGTGSSTGIPVIGCQCRVCKSEDPRDQRFRITVHLESPRTSLLLDVSPDIRLQALRNGLSRVHGVFLTHGHHDHVSGIDELRIFNFIQKGNIPVYGNVATLQDIRNRFPYVFQPIQEGGGIPVLDLRPIDSFETVEFGDFRMTPIPVRHGNLEIYGYIINEKVAFITDCSGIPEDTFEMLRGIDTLILDAVRSRPHPTHFSFDESRDMIRRIAPRNAFFIHMNHDLSHRDLEEIYGPEIQIPYDGLSLEL